MKKMRTSRLKVKIDPFEQEQINAFISGSYEDDQNDFLRSALNEAQEYTKDPFWHPFGTKETLDRTTINYVDFYIRADLALELDTLAHEVGVRPTSMFYSMILQTMATAGHPVKRI